MGMSPTQLTLREMRRRYARVDKVEHWNAFAKIRQDLWSIVDVLCLGPGVCGVQCTSWDNVSARVNKIAESDVLPLLKEAKVRILVQGWKKVGRKWQFREVEMSP